MFLCLTLTYSVTSVEPGPVETAFIPNIRGNQQGSSFAKSDPDLDSNVDEKTTEMRRAFLENYSQLWDMMQSGPDIAEIIKNCVCEERPPVRIQTSPATTDLAKQYLVDPSGEKQSKFMFSFMQ